MFRLFVLMVIHIMGILYFLYVDTIYEHMEDNNKDVHMVY
jgi:hypothetical protein